jgi:hypothetical protein
MALEDDRKGPQSKGQNDGKSGSKAPRDAKSQNDGKGQNYGKFVAGEAELTTQNTKRQDDRYSDTEGSEDEQDRTYKYHRRIIDSWLKDKKYNLKERKYLIARFKSDRDKQNIIHRAIRELGRTKKGALPPALDFIEETVLQQPSHFTDVDGFGYVPMLEAAKAVPSILFMAVDLLIADSTRGRIGIKCPEGQKCPLWEVADGRRKQCQTKKTSGRVNGSGPNGEPTWKASDKTNGELREDKTRCLHDEIDVRKLLEEDRKLKEVLEKALNPVAKARECLQSLISETKFDPGQKVPQLVKLESFKTILSLCHKDVFEKAPASGYSPLQQAVRLLDGESLDFKLLYDVIQTLVEHCPVSIFCKANINGTTTTAYRLLKELKQSNKAPNKDWIQRSDELLKEQCIGYRKKILDPATNEVKYDDMWGEKRDLLYWDPKTGKSPLPIA